MNLNIWYAPGAGALLLLVSLKNKLAKKPFIQKYAVFADVFLYETTFVLLAVYFYTRHIWAGAVMAVLAGGAIGKYLYDKAKSGGDEDQ